MTICTLHYLQRLTEPVIEFLHYSRRGRYEPLSENFLKYFQKRALQVLLLCGTLVSTRKQEVINMRQKTKNTSFRLYEDTPRKLEELAKLAGISKTKYFERLVEADYQAKIAKGK